MPKAAPITLTPEFQSAFELLENSTQNVFLTGKAGTGKSTFLQYFRLHSKKRMAIAAPTGIAALNVQGQTIHSLFRLPPRFVDLQAIKPDRRALLKELELLIIDEISMVRADVFDGIDKVLKLARKSDEPFGGVQLCVIGDLFQLPPVVSREEQEFFAQYYDSSFFFAAKAYGPAKLRRVEFTTIHRQNDADFIAILNAIRSGVCRQAEIDALNQRVDRKAQPLPGALVLTGTNALADTINSEQLARLPGLAALFEGRTLGDFGMKGPRLPAAEQLWLKKGAQVMFVKNDAAGRWVNGSVGVVLDIEAESVRIKTESGEWDVEREKWKTIGYEYDDIQERIVEKTLGSYSQFPLMLAWAVTIHKSQGKTLSSVVIDLGHGAFAAGQLYVALSRCKNLAGIALRQPVTRADIRCDAKVTAFMAQELEAA